MQMNKALCSKTFPHAKSGIFPIIAMLKFSIMSMGKTVSLVLTAFP
jgi:hypothetical protein